MADRQADPLVAELRARFTTLRTTTERAAGQVSDPAFFQPLDEGANSIATLMQHMGGVLASRFTDFLETDGEKPDRNRDAEFIAAPESTREDILRRWRTGWERLSAALDSVGPGDMGRTVTIRAEPHTVIGALLRQLAHLSYHSGQVVQLARHHAGASWQWLTIPPGQSEQFTRRHAAQFGASAGSSRQTPA